MKLVLLGTTGYHPSDNRQTACFMLPELGVILDAGTAMYRARKYLATDELDDPRALQQLAGQSLQNAAKGALIDGVNKQLERLLPPKP